MFKKKPLSIFLALFVVLVLATAAVGSVAAQESPARPEFVEGELLVKLKPGIAATKIEELNSRFRTRTIGDFEFIRTFHLRLPRTLSVEKAITQIEKLPYVEYAIPNRLYYLDQTVSNDASFTDLWGLDNTGQTGGTADADIDAPEAWDITTGSSTVVVAVIDSGLDMTHEDIVGNIWVNPGEVAGNGIDDDGNGYVDDVNGWDFSSNDNNPSPVGGACVGHGTHTAGTIGARGNNGLGVTGVNWNVQIMPLKAFRITLRLFCSASDADLLEAVEYHTKMGVRISSNSWGGGGYSQAMFDAIRASNSLFIAAAGNNGSNNDNGDHYPSDYNLDNIIAVAATNHSDALASFSNYGTNSVDIAAPGVDILSTVPTSSYNYLSGTSMATPHVAGVAALLLAQAPDLTTNEMKWRILNGADSLGLPVATGGRLNAYNTLAFGLAPMAVTVEIEPLGSTSVRAGDLVEVQVTLSNNDTIAHTISGSVYGRLEDGREKQVAPIVQQLNPGESSTFTVVGQVPGGIAPGISFKAFAQAETSASFDEDAVSYIVVP